MALEVRQMDREHRRWIGGGIGDSQPDMIPLRRQLTIEAAYVCHLGDSLADRALVGGRLTDGLIKPRPQPQPPLRLAAHNQVHVDVVHVDELADEPLVRRAQREPLEWYLRLHQRGPGW